MIRIIGDVLIDEYWYGTTNRISPEAPIPIVNVEKKFLRLGGAGNVYQNVKVMFPRCQIWGYIDSKFGYLFQDETERNAVWFSTDKMPHKLRVFSDDHMMARIDDEVIIPETKLEDKFQCEKDRDIVILSDYSKGTIKDPQNIIRKCSKVICDPKKSLDCYKGAYILKPNKKEFDDYVGRVTTPKELLSEGRRVRELLNIEHFIVTLGSEGVLYVGDEIQHYPATAQEVYDVTGAGDTFTACLAICIALKLNVPQAVRVANIMSGYAVSTKGTYILNAESFEEELRRLANVDSSNRFEGVYWEEIDPDN